MNRNIEASINRRRGSGQPLPETTRAFFESRFKFDFRNVRVHNNANAHKLNKSLNAHAFTIGQDVFFNSGSYESGSLRGRRLLAHELAHVVQQRKTSASSEIYRKNNESTNLKFNPEDDIKSILGTKPEKQRVELNEEEKLELYKYLKQLRRTSPELTQDAKNILEERFADYWIEIWKESKKPLAGYTGTRYSAGKIMRKAKELGLKDLSGKKEMNWTKKFLGSDVLFFSEHHYGAYNRSGEFDDLDIRKLRTKTGKPIIFENVKLIMISSCSVLSKSALPTWRERFPNAYILGWHSSSPDKQYSMMRTLLSKLPKDLILDDSRDMKKIINDWEDIIESVIEKIKVKTKGPGYATPEGTVKYMRKNKEGKWVWKTEKRK